MRSQFPIFRSTRRLCFRGLVVPISAGFGLAFAGPALAVDDNILPDGDFENIPVTGEKQLPLPKTWHQYQWGPFGKAFSTVCEPGAGRDGGTAVRAQNLEPGAQAGTYTKIDLEPGTYELSAWVRTAPGKSGKARLYFGKSYSQNLPVGENWQNIKYTLSFSQPLREAEINVQSVSGEADSLWIDDVVLRPVEGREFVRVKDTRENRPRTLLFSPINVNYLKDTAPEWAARGFRGFLFDQIMYQWESDVWAADGDPQTRGEDDALLQEVRAANAAAKAVGIDSNFVKVALRNALPNFFDDAAWAGITERFKQGARFARLSGCAGVAIDAEYIAGQYELRWPGYQEYTQSTDEIQARFRERWQTIVSGMLEEFPEMILLTLPEGMRMYGPMYDSMFEGMLSAMASADAPGGLHVLTELTYNNTDAAALGLYAGELQGVILGKTPAKLHSYWNRRCSIALGGWPFGYYRDVAGPDGKSLGYSGRKEVFGDQVVGSYADKSGRFSPEDFAGQMAGLNTYSPRFNWIYGHGDVFTHMTPEQIEKYKKGVHKSLFNVHIPTDGNLDAYIPAIAHPELLVPKPEK